MHRRVWAHGQISELRSGYQSSEDGRTRQVISMLSHDRLIQYRMLVFPLDTSDFYYITFAVVATGTKSNEANIQASSWSVGGCLNRTAAVPF